VEIACSEASRADAAQRKDVQSDLYYYLVNRPTQGQKFYEDFAAQVIVARPERPRPQMASSHSAHLCQPGGNFAHPYAGLCFWRAAGAAK
jgi:hypothetical protein